MNTLDDHTDLADASQDDVTAAQAAAEATEKRQKLVDAVSDADEAVYDALSAAGHTTSSKRSTWAGGRLNRTHHLSSYCSKLRASRPAAFEWGAYDSELASFNPATRKHTTRRKLCVACQQAQPESFATMMALMLRNISISARRVGDVAARGSGSVDLTAMQDMVQDVEEQVAGVRQLIEQAPAEVDSTTLSEPLRRIDQLVAACHALYAQASATSPGLVRAEEALLAAASAATTKSAYALVPNRKGRHVPALVSYRSDTDDALMYGVNEAFFEWVKFCQANPDADPREWRRDGFEPQHVSGDWATVDAVSSVTTWNVPADGSLNPWELAVANWKVAAAQQLNTLLDDWCDHYQWVRSAPDVTTTLVIYDARQVPLSTLGTLDRYDLLQRTLARFAPKPTSHPKLWVVNVPTAAARALDGYTAAGALVQAASLDGLAPERLDEALTLALGFEENFSGPQWFTSAAHAAISCLT
jgi:hypothetical protein